MSKERKALLVHHSPGTPAEDSVAELNRLLADDWHVVSTTGMGGAAAGDGSAGDASHFVALVILEREPQRAVRGFVGPS